MKIPFAYNLRSLWVRKSATLLTVLGLGATVAVLVGVLSLNQGFRSLFAESGRDTVAVFLRPGAKKEGDSAFTKNRALLLSKSCPEIALDENGELLASFEIALAVRRFKVDGGETNVPIRGVQKQSYAIHKENLKIVEGRQPAVGQDEVIVGRRITERIRDCKIGDVLTLNVTPFRVVGILDHNGPFSTEIWGDVDRIGQALDRPGYNRVIAQLKPEADVKSLALRLEDDKQVPASVFSEKEYLSNQSGLLSAALVFLAGALGLIMGVAAIFTATNTMLSAISARTNEIGILKAIGFRPAGIFIGFLFEALLLGLVGGIIGCLVALPVNGLETGTTNWDTFTETAFAFQVTPKVLMTAVIYSVALGLIGGALPAWRAARMAPTQALRRA